MKNILWALFFISSFAHSAQPDDLPYREPCHETTPLEAWGERINPPNKTKELISSKFRKCSDVEKTGEILRESGNAKNIQYVIDYSQNEAFKGASFVENNISSIDNNEIWSVSCGNITNKGILQKECRIRQRNLLILMHPHEFPQIVFGGSNLKIKGISLLNYKIDNNPIFTLPVNIIDKSIASNKILTQLKNGEKLTYTLPKKSSKSFDTNYINLKGLNESLELADKILISNVSISD